ncbi:YdcF family protein [Candidatus Woesearchaeota archaeon]|nr:YdcF family protein [Candidatus Woesearchaeota archaeon]
MSDKKFDAIIVLGAGITRKGNLTRVAKSSEASVMRRYAIRKGVKAADVLVESKARDTIGNAFFTCKKFLLPNSWRRIIVVTSIFHLPRARFIFGKVLGKSYAIKLVASKRVLSKKLFEKMLKIEQGLFMLTKILSILVADGDMKAIGNFIRKNPLYTLYNRVSAGKA